MNITEIQPGDVIKVKNNRKRSGRVYDVIEVDTRNYEDFGFVRILVAMDHAPEGWARYMTIDREIHGVELLQRKAVAA